MSEGRRQAGARLEVPCVLGLDVGTRGARVLAVDAEGTVLASASQPLEPVAGPVLPPGWSEQDPESWWKAACLCLREVVAAVRPTSVCAVAVTSTSGTVVPVDATGRALRPAILYNDTRAVEEAAFVQEAGAALAHKLGYAFQPSFALPRLVWIRQHEPSVFDHTTCFLHAADFLVMRLTGEIGVSDFSNALKTGYDLADLRWGGWIESRLGIPLSRLPRVLTPGEKIGAICTRAAEETGLSAGTPVMAGATDGTAAFLASGAILPGEWNSTLGTTLVVRGVSPHLVRDPAGRIYCHRHPEGTWLPGGASSTGGEWMEHRFSKKDWVLLDRRALHISPTPSAVYPLVRQGERLPFVNPNAEGFVELGARSDLDHLYAAHLEGTACVERWIYEVMEDLGMPVSECIYATGGGARSREWLQIRADVLHRVMRRPAVVEAAFGAALLAAAHTLHASLSQAVRAMVRLDCQVEPRPGMHALYEELYRRFREACAQRGLG